MTYDNGKLPEELVWSDDGHAGDEVLTALADGQDSIIPDDAIAHVHACTHCTERLGAETLLSLSIGEAFAHMPQAAFAQEVAPVSIAPVSSRRFSAIPLRAVAAALAIAGIGALPALSQFPSQISEFSSLAPRAIPYIAKNGLFVCRALLGAMGPLQLGLTVASVLVLTIVAVGLIRALPAPVVMPVVK